MPKEFQQEYRCLDPRLETRASRIQGKRYNRNEIHCRNSCDTLKFVEETAVQVLNFQSFVHWK